MDSNGKRLFEIREYKDWFEKNISKKVVLLDGASLTIGCAMTFNRILLMKATQGSLEVLIDGQVSHDYWLGVVATYFGSVVYADETYILHRKHDNSVTNSGKKRKRSFLKHYRNNAKTIYKFYKDGNSLLENDRDYIMLVAKKKNLFEKLRLMSDKEFCYASKLSTLKLRLQIFLGIF